MTHTGANDFYSIWTDVGNEKARETAQAAADNAPPQVPRPRICMMPGVSALTGGDPNIRRRFQDFDDAWRGRSPRSKIRIGAVDHDQASLPPRIAIAVSGQILSSPHQALTCVRVVCQSGPEVLRLPHVVKSLHQLLDRSPEVSLAGACKGNFVYLVRRKLTKLSLEPADSKTRDRSFRKWQFEESVANAVAHGNLEMVQMLHNYFTECRIPRPALVQAAKTNRVDIFRWFVANFDELRWDVGIVGYAVSGEHLGLAKWLYERSNAATARERRLWADLAARRGNLDILKWVCGPSEDIDLKWTLSCAVEAGKTEVVKWVIDRLGPDTIGTADFSINISSAVSIGHIDLLEWLVSNYPRKCRIEFGEREAARNGRFDIIRLLHDNNIEGCSGRVIESAAARGHFEIVKWLQNCRHRAEFEDGQSRAIESAAIGGHLEIVKWLHENMSEECTVSAMDYAAYNDHADVVKWLHENRSEGCTAFAMDIAATKGNLNLVKWLSANRSEGCTVAAMNSSAACGRLDIVEWLHENRTEGCTTDAMDNAATYGHLNVLKWLHTNRSEGCTTKAMDGAAGNGYLNVVQWLHANRSEGCTTKAIDDAVKNNYFDVVDWLDRNRSEGGTAAAVDFAAKYYSVDDFCWWYFVGPAPCERSALEAAVLNGNFGVALFLHQRCAVFDDEFNVVGALKDCSDDSKRWEFAEWLYEYQPEEFNAIAADLFAD